MKAKLYLAILFLFLAFEVFSGALRYLFSELGAPWLVYLPKALILVALVGVLLETAYRGKISRTLLFSALVIGAYAIVGAYHTGNALQPLFTIFATLPLVFGIVVAPYLEPKQLVKYAALLWLCAATGIVIDYLIPVPWDGASYSLAGLEMRASRDWTTFGVERIAGFSRASFAAGGHVLFLALPLVFFVRSSLKRLLVWLATAVLIVLTTAKTTAGIYVLFTLLFVSLPLIPRRIKRALGRTLPYIVGLVGIYMPLTTLLTPYHLELGNPTSEFLFTSFGARLTQMWPEAFQLVLNHGDPILGRGIGGIGTAQGLFEPDLANSADNMYLYLYASLGLLALPVVLGYMRRVSRINLMGSPWQRFLWFCGVAVLLAGWTENGLESAFLAILLGVTFRLGSSRHKAARLSQPILDVENPATQRHAHSGVRPVGSAIG